MQGRKPVPRPLVDLENLPPCGARVPAYPKTLPEGMPRECWNEITPVMVAKNIYDEDCTSIVEAYCIQRARFLEANAKVGEHGALMSGRVSGWLRVANESQDRMLKLASELGLTPVTRHRAGKTKGSAGGGEGLASKFLKKTG